MTFHFSTPVVVIALAAATAIVYASDRLRDQHREHRHDRVVARWLIIDCAVAMLALVAGCGLVV